MQVARGGHKSDMDDAKQGLQATDGTPTGALDDPQERPEQTGVLGGSEPHTDTRPADPPPHDEVKPGKPSDDGT